MRTPIRALLILLLAAPAAQAQFKELEKKTQSGANAILAIDAAAVKGSLLARNQGWTRKLEAAYVDRSIFLPPEAERVLVSAVLRPDRGFDSDSVLAQLDLEREFSLPAVARANGGKIESLRQQDVVSGLGDSLLIPLGKDLLAIFSPANRQLAGRWISESAGGKGTGLSPYLKSAVERVGKDRQIVLAIDLEDVVSASDATARLQASKLLAGTPYKVEQVAGELQSLLGVVIEIEISTDARARARIDFARPVTFSAEIAKRITMATLAEQGLAVDDLAKHLFVISGKTITVEGELSSTGLRRILSLLDLPGSSAADVSGAASPETASGDMTAQKSQAYFRSVVSLLDDLRGDRTKQDPRGGQDAVWMDKYAQKIDRLPVLSVDNELLDWGAKTAQTLRVMAGQRRNAGLSAGAQKSGLRTGVFTDSFFNVGVSTATATAADANQIDVQAGNQATVTRVEGWRLIDNATAEMRRKQTQRYQIEF